MWMRKQAILSFLQTSKKRSKRMPGRILKLSHILQRVEADCLVACALMLLEAAGFRARYENILRLLGTSEIGTPLSRIQLLSRISSNLIVIYREGELKDI